MAWYDNRHWLLTHVRNSFISCDDTGMCDIVMGAEDLPRLLARKRSVDSGPGPGPGSGPGPPGRVDDVEERCSTWDRYPDMGHDDDDPLANSSYELQHDLDFSLRRQRSNTAQRLEKLERAARKAAKIKVIKWSDGQDPDPTKDMGELFAKKAIVKRSAAGKSLLSDLLVKCTDLPQTRYLEYASFDGQAQFTLPTKSYKIFMTSLPEDLRNYPIAICVVANAKICDLVGLTCYKYSIAHPEAALASVSSYGLYICEDDGEVDFDFPCLDADEPCSKYGFTCLGLVDVKSNGAAKPSEVQMCSIPDKGGFNSIAASESSKTDANRPKDSSKNLDKKADNNGNVRSRNAARANASVSFREPKTTGVMFSDFPVKDRTPDEGQSGTTWPQFHDSEALKRMKAHESLMEAPLYKAYRVQIINKVRSNTDLFLGISGDKIEMDPIKNNFNFWKHMKRITYNMDSIAFCEMLEAKSSRATFRLYYVPIARGSVDSGSTGSQHSSGSDTVFKHFNFECDHPTAKEITEKVSMILKLKPSACNKEFVAMRDRSKLSAKKSFL